MAVSQNVQNALHAHNASAFFFAVTLAEAEDKKAELRATGEYARVSHVRWNNGNRERPRWEYKVLAWKAR